jgi:NAD(P)H-dependent flavin oxidoreductase YrpB (nitropropane dioxygenase family)
MLTTRFTDLVGCTIPIQQAGMGAVSPPELVAAVSNAGGLGMLGTARWGGRTLPNLNRLIDQVEALTDSPFGVNFIVAPEHMGDTDPGCFALAARRARVVEFFWGWPDPALVETVHEQGALVSWQVGSREEAVAAVVAGSDLIVAQGVEAGGHVRGTIGVLALLDEVLAAVDVPVLAAGGVGTGRALAAVLAAGADGARVGTRFVAAEESDAHPLYVEALLAARPAGTVYTEAFSVGWDAPHRVLRSCVEAATAFPGDVVGEVPTLDGTREALPRLAPEAINRGTTGTIAAMPLWAGESVGGVTRVQPAAEIVRELANDAERLIRRWRPEDDSSTSL